MLTRIVELLKAKKVFVRERMPMETRALGILLVYLGLSYRKTEEVLSMFGGGSYEAARQWYHRAKHLLSTPEKKYRPTIAIDETKIKIQGKWHYMWTAIDTQTWEILAIQITKNRSGLDTYIFLRKILKTCTNKPHVYVDGGPWYPWALQRMGLTWEHKTFGPRNPIEQWYHIFKHRIKRFYKRWPHNAKPETVLSWCLAFVAIYNIRRD